MTFRFFLSFLLVELNKVYKNASIIEDLPEKFLPKIPTIPLSLSKSILFYKVLDIKKIGVNNVDREKLKNSIIEREKNELLNLYSNNYLSKLKNTMSISFK